MTAEPAIRAQRRLLEMQAKGETMSFDEVLASVIERDRIDENREHSPLRRADDAVLLDNSHMTVEQQMEWVMRIVAERTAETPNCC